MRQNSIDSSKLSVPLGQFSKIRTKEAAYVLGLLWADGNLYKNNISLRNMASDMEQIVPVFRKTGRWCVYNFHYKDRKPSIHISTNSRMLADILRAYDYHIKSGTAPTKVLHSIPDALKKYWWRGYFDGDGTIKKQIDSYTVSLCSCYEQDWREFQKLCENLSVRYDCRTEKWWNKTKTKEFSCSKAHVYRKNDAIALLSYFYKGYPRDRIGLARKHELFQQKKLRAKKNNHDHAAN